MRNQEQRKYIDNVISRPMVPRPYAKIPHPQRLNSLRVTELYSNKLTNVGLNTNKKEVVETIQNQTKLVPDVVKDKQKPVGLGFIKIKNWHEFRLFMSGALLSAGLISFGFYLGLSQPIHGIESPVSPVNQGAQGQQAENFNIEPIDEGVDQSSVDRTPAPKITSDMPKRLIIDKLGIDAPIRGLGLAKDGSLAVPGQLSQVGWYKLSSKPGQSGTVLMDGHFGNDNRAVFRKLDNLTAGDIIQVKLGNDTIIKYKVISKATFNSDSVPMDKLVEVHAEERLNLITCIGTWDKNAKSFTKRLAIFTEKI